MVPFLFKGNEMKITYNEKELKEILKTHFETMFGKDKFSGVDWTMNPYKKTLSATIDVPVEGKAVQKDSYTVEGIRLRNRQEPREEPNPTKNMRPHEDFVSKEPVEISEEKKEEPEKPFKALEEEEKKSSPDIPEITTGEEEDLPF